MNDLIFLPVLVQMGLTISLYFRLGAAKTQAAAQGNVDETRRGLYDDAWPESVMKINNNIRNQFEIPLFFYILVLILWALNAVGFLAHVFAWLFVGSRFVHSSIHTGDNDVPRRRDAFKFGVYQILLLGVLVLWALLFG